MTFVQYTVVALHEIIASSSSSSYVFVQTKETHNTITFNHVSSMLVISHVSNGLVDHVHGEAPPFCINIV